eukprot:3921220-Pleurochrysis_carterae.AAC.1
MKRKASPAGPGRRWRWKPRCKAWYAWWNETMASTRAARASCAAAACVHERTDCAAALMREPAGIGKAHKWYFR